MRRALVGVMIGFAACTGVLQAQTGDPQADLPPAGFGRLTQEQLSVQFATGDIQVRFLPLDERVLRLLATDAYTSLHGLVDSRKAVLDSAAAAAGVSSPGLALVSFFALRADARFDPENVSLNYRSQLYRPAAIVPFTGNFSNRQLPVRGQATAIYVFELPIPVYDQFDVVYGAVQSSAWRDIVTRLDRERAFVTSRAQSQRPDSSRAGP
jgi:hypothetical protein